MRTIKKKLRSKTNGKKMLGVVIAAVALVGVLASTWLFRQEMTTESEAAGGSTVISFNPSSVKIKPVGQQMSLNVVMNTNQDTIAATVIDISYDATIFEQVTYENGTTLPVVLREQSGTSGKLSITLGAEPDAPFKGTAILGSVKLKVKRVAGTQVSFTNRTIASALGKRGNVIKTRNLADILVETTPTPTPTVSGCFPSPTCQPPSGGCHYVIQNCQCVKVCSPTVTVTTTPTLTPTVTVTPTPSVTPPGGYNWFQESVWYWAMERWGFIPKQIDWFFE
jgi:hypothetical protein